MTRTTRSVLALGLAVLAFLAVNVLAQRTLREARLDLTAEGLHTLSPGTLNVIRSLREPVTLTLYLSEEAARSVPMMRLYGQRVREVLEEYAGRSDGRIRLEVVNPEPFSDEEDVAVRAGIEAVPLDRTAGTPFYFGLIGTNAARKQEIVPFLDPHREPFLEHDLTKLVHTLGEPAKPVVGILTELALDVGAGGPMELMRSGARPSALYQQLKERFDVRLLAPTVTAVPDDIAVLMVARPRDLPEPAVYAIDQFVLKGGKALLFVDPWAESDGASGDSGIANPGASKAAVLPELFDAWGLTMDPEHFAADPRLAIPVATRRRTVAHPAWLALGAESQNPDDVVTNGLGTINVASAGALGIKGGAAIGFTPMLTTTPAGQLAELTMVMEGPDPDKVQAALKPGGGVLVLAARVSGRLKTAFPGRDGLKESVESANLIVVADSDLLDDRFWVEDRRALGQRAPVPFAANGDFVANALENLLGSGDLISLRRRAGSARPFTLVEDMRRTAGQQAIAHERELRRRLQETERQIADLQAKATDAAQGMLRPAEERAAIERFRTEAGRIRKELRDTQRTLNRDIERLAAGVKAVNIVAVPLAVALGGVVLAGWRIRRRAQPVRH